MSREYVEKRLREIEAARVSKARSPVNERPDQTAVSDGCAGAQLSTEGQVAKQQPPNDLGSKEHVVARRRTGRYAEGADTGKLVPQREAEPQIPRMHVSGRFVYECTSDRFNDSLTPKSSCSALIDRLLGVLAAKPAYLHPKDAVRYAALIRAFQRFEGVHGSVADLPVQRLWVALRDWVGDALNADEGLLVPTFVLDAARFIEAHAYGRDFFVYGGDSWEIKSLVEGLENSRSDELDSDKRLKGEITSGLRGLLVRAEVPTGARIVNRSTKEQVVGPGSLFVQLERCHLSSGLGPDITHLEIVEDAPMRHDVAEEFSFLGCFWPGSAVAELIEEGELKSAHRRQNLYMPGRLINAMLEVVHDKYPPVLRWVDIPVWAVK
jgi:hypothetical protein